MRTAASDILEYPYVSISSVRSTLKKCTAFSSLLGFTHLKLILEPCTTSGVYLESYLTSMKLLAVSIFAPSWIFGKVLNVALQPRFLIFFHYLCLNTLMRIQTFCFFFLKECSCFAHVT